MNAYAVSASESNRRLRGREAGHVSDSSFSGAVLLPIDTFDFLPCTTVTDGTTIRA